MSEDVLERDVLLTGPVDCSDSDLDIEDEEGNVDIEATEAMQS